MPLLGAIDTRSINSSLMPMLKDDNIQLISIFPRRLVAPPRISQGFHQVHISNEANIRLISTITSVTENWAVGLFKTWKDSSFNHAASNLFIMEPADVDFLNGEHDRNCWIDRGENEGQESTRINFTRPFVTPPKVVVFFSGIDLEMDNNWRVQTTATHIDNYGFTLNITSSSDTLLHLVRVGWIAYPEDRKQIFSTSVTTKDLRPADNIPQQKNSRSLTFNDGTRFWENPSVFIALNAIDIDCKANLCIKTWVDGVSTTGLIWHIDSLKNTVLYSAGASIIAFN